MASTSATLQGGGKDNINLSHSTLVPTWPILHSVPLPSLTRWTVSCSRMASEQPAWKEGNMNRQGSSWGKWSMALLQVTLPADIGLTTEVNKKRGFSLLFFLSLSSFISSGCSSTLQSTKLCCSTLEWKTVSVRYLVAQVAYQEWCRSPLLNSSYVSQVTNLLPHVTTWNCCS